MKFINLYQLFILFSYLYLITADIIVIGPTELSSMFKNQLIPMTFDKIGKSSYDFYTRGQLFIDENNLEACNKIAMPRSFGDAQYNEDFKILIAKRGGCSFVHKERNAKISGYSMVIVVNNMENDIKKIIMTDDGSGNDIFIPISMISKDDGYKIIEYIQKNRDSIIIVEINFIKKIAKKLDLKFFFSSSE